ncbi:MAG: histidine kinase dimerization/phosphoacceptor domain -containing protein [Cyclobacteriaceae bacterium]
MVQGQNQSLLDSLLIEVEEAGNDSLKLEFHYELCYQWAEYSFDSSMFHAKKMEAIANENSDPRFIYKALSAKGLAHDYQYSFDSAIFYYEAAKSLARENEYRKEEAISTFNIGVVHYYSGEMERAIDNYLEAEKVYLDINDQRNLGILYNNLGIIYRSTKKYELAKETYQKSLVIKRKRDDIAGIMNTLSNLSSVNQYLKDFESARIASEEVIELAKTNQNRGAYLAELINLGKIHLATEKPDLALTLYEEAGSLLSEESPYTFKIHIFQQLSSFYVDRKELNKAKNYLDRVEELLTEEHLEVAMNHYLTSVDYYRMKNDSKSALEALQKAFEIRESLFDNEVLEKTTELEQLYKKDKRENEISRLNSENEIQSLNLARQEQERNGLIILSILVIGVAVLFYVLFRQKRKSLAERETLLKEIHHRVKNNLQIISSLLNLQAGSLEDEAAADAVKEGQYRVRSMALIHEKLYKESDLRGVDVLDYLQNLLGELFAAFGVDRDRIGFNVNTNGIKMDIDTVIPLGLIITELITNSLKYAFDKSSDGLIEIKMEESDGRLNVIVADNGSGTTKQRLESSNSFGWKMIKSLSRKLKADIDITNNNGTMVQLNLTRYKLVV